MQLENEILFIYFESIPYRRVTTEQNVDCWIHTELKTRTKKTGIEKEIAVKLMKMLSK